MRFSVPLCAATLGALAFMSACTEEGVSMAPPPPAAPPATIVPAAEPLRQTRTETTTATAVSPDGRTTVTTTETTTTSIGFNPAALAMPGGAGATRPNTAADYAGTWNVANARNPQCRFVLQAPVNNQPGWVSNMGCFGDPLFGVTRWSLRGTELVLTDGFNRSLVSLRATGPNRLEGGGVTMWR